MNNIQLQTILNSAYKKTFLDKIEYLMENEKDYKRSEFFKNTKIPLLTLYEKFDIYQSKGFNIIDEFNDFVEGLDMNMVAEKLSDFIDAAEKNKKIVDTINDLINNFNYEKISEIATEIQEELNKTLK